MSVVSSQFIVPKIFESCLLKQQQRKWGLLSQCLTTVSHLSSCLWGWVPLTGSYVPKTCFTTTSTTARCLLAGCCPLTWTGSQKRTGEGSAMPLWSRAASELSSAPTQLLPTGHLFLPLLQLLQPWGPLVSAVQSLNNGVSHPQTALPDPALV